MTNKRTCALEAEVHRLSQERDVLTQKLIRAEHERLLDKQEIDFLRGLAGPQEPKLRTTLGLRPDAEGLLLAVESEQEAIREMPKDGELTLSDVCGPTLSIICKLCAKRGRYAVARLIEQHGDAKLTELLMILANCPKARPASVYDQCRAMYERTPS
jgi:hypothetical protein